jgi:tol-pal system protein YbgF
MMTISVKRVFLAVLLALVLSTVASADIVKDKYDAAMDLYNQGQLSSAIPAFRIITENYPNHSLTDNAQYWIGEAYFRLKRFEQAIIEFDRTLLYKDTNKREDALYKLASCHERLGKTDAAKEMYSRFLAEFPNSRHASHVLKKLNMF